MIGYQVTKNICCANIPLLWDAPKAARPTAARTVSRKAMKKDDIFHRISPNEALEILKQLSKTDHNLKTKITELAEELFRDVDKEYTNTKKNLNQSLKIGPPMSRERDLDIS
jgi:hypothetical protein